MAATGAFLLLASASVFIAVRWDQVTGAAKLGLVVALTGAFLVGGRVLRRTLPATGDVLFHLGALLIPVDIAALGLRLHLGWRALLLSEGIVTAAAFGALAVATRSVVLRWAASTAVIVLAAGMAAVSPLPAPALLAAAALAATLLGRHRLAPLWAAVAGLSPVCGALATGVLGLGDGTGVGVLTELGLGGHAAAVAALGTSALAAGVLGREAARRRDLSLVALAGTCLATGAATTWVNASPPREAWFLAGPALLLLVEVVAVLCGRDHFWGRPARAVALGSEIVALVVAAPTALALLVVAPFIDGGFDLFRTGWTPQPAAALAWVLLAGCALLASWRRQGLSRGTPSWPGAGEAPAPSRPTGWSTPQADGITGPGPHDLRGGMTTVGQASGREVLAQAVVDARTVLFLAAALGAGLVAGTGSTVATAAGLVALAGVLVAVTALQPAAHSQRSTATGGGAAPDLRALDAGRGLPRGGVAVTAAATAALWAPLVVGPSHPLLALPIGLVGAIVLGGAALLWRRVAGAAVALAGAGSVVAFAGCAIAAAEIGRTPAMLAAVVAAWALAALVERGAPPAGHLVRATMLLGVVGALTGSAAQILAVAGLATLAFALDALRHDEPLIGVGAGLVAPLVVGSTGAVAGLAGPTTGLVLVAAAAAFAGITPAYPARWRLPFVVAAATGLAAGLVLAAGDPQRLAECLLVVGGLAVGAGILARNGLVGHLGGAVATAGLALHLTLDGVTANEPVAAAVALQLVVAGWQQRRRAAAPSSWLAYGPAIGLLGAVALAERLAGGPAWHSLVAGSVGVAAVAAGGWRRLAGPLFLGTGLVATVAVLESLSTLAGIPTWAWLAAGGSTLLVTGVALERSATAPVEAGRRLVDVIGQRFS